MTAHCPKHGDVLPIKGMCPWGCQQRITAKPARIPRIDPRIELPALLASRQIELETA